MYPPGDTFTLSHLQRQQQQQQQQEQQKINKICRTVSCIRKCVDGECVEKYANNNGIHRQYEQK